ncbi:RAQPRD family integrative conjugative element protein [Pseudomonas sp. TE50-2]|jgi:RAQPRD family integrative conjugative element protein|uniref:integrative conjugative element protein, RAQPRD family n=1 Tax=Pseudomonas sp. TE50-2 TaxID=3142707 RepID=UPI003467E462
MKNTSPSLLLVCLVSLGAAAHDVRERLDLSLVQRQIAAIEQLANRASSDSVDIAGARYRFDYPRFTADLERMRQGVHKYLSPSRAQPTDLVELTGDYRAEVPHWVPSDEHD